MVDSPTASMTNPAGERLLALLPVALFCLGLGLIYHDTVWTMVQIWDSSKTYKHGYIIAPISLWLIWDRRHYLASVPLQPAAIVLGLMFLVGPLWLLGNLIDVNVVTQVTFVALLITGVWAMVGHRMALAIAFPLGYLFFAVPLGDWVVPSMMEFTATSTVAMVKWSGVPVYREGMYFTLPTGSWSVVYACSGVRYLIAAVTLGVLYAYLTYRSLYRRLIFSLVSIIVPILANSARAYIIVMLGHLSDMKIATGVDHLLYGWVFFGIVMFILFWIGAIWREDVDEEPAQDAAASVGTSSGFAGSWLVLVLALVVAGLWPALSSAMKNRESREVAAALVAPQPQSGWQAGEDPQWPWRPDSRNPDREITAFYRNAQYQLAVYVDQHLQQRDGEELVSGLDLMASDDARWRMLSRGKATLELNGQAVTVEEKLLEVPGSELIVLSFYRIGEHYTSHRYVAKLWELVEKLSFSTLGSARITLITDAPVNRGGHDVLADFTAKHLDGIEDMLLDGLED